MKKIFYIFVSSLIMLVGCTKESGRIKNQLVGDWHYTAEESEVKEDIWISFAQDGTFQMYQMIGEGAYWSTTGKYLYDEETQELTGVYSDKYPWKYSYKISFLKGDLVMTAVELTTYSVTYTREDIPAQVREKSLPLTKAEQVERHL